MLNHLVSLDKKVIITMPYDPPQKKKKKEVCGGERLG